MGEIKNNSRLLQHTVSSASRKVATMREFPEAFSRKKTSVKPVTFEEASSTAEKMRTGLKAKPPSTLNTQKQSMTFDVEEKISGAQYFKRQISDNDQEATVSAIKNQPPMGDIFNSPGNHSDKQKVLKDHLWLNSIVGTEKRKEGVKSGGDAMLETAELFGKAQNKRLALAAYNSKGYWQGQGFTKTGLEQREDGAPAPFPVMTKKPRPTII